MKYVIDEKKIIYADLTPEEGVVLNLQTKNYYQLNETGQIVWQAIAAQKTREEIVATLLNQFDIDKNSAEQDVDGLLKKFREEQLIQIENAAIPTFSVEDARKSKKEKAHL